MARGGKGGGRGGNRGRGLAGYPPQAQGSRTSFAQSAGRVSTFQGTAGGGRAFGNKGGSAGIGAIGRTELSNGLTATIRSPGGDGTLVHDAFSTKRGPALQPNRRGAKTNASIVKPKARGGAQRGYGGSTQ